MFKIEMLLAGHGDCLWIEYGDPNSPRRVLIDGGATGTHKRVLRQKLLDLPEQQRRFELLMISHIDADHITGVLDLLEDKAVNFQADDIWFNGYRHLPDENPDTLGPVQGEKLTDLLVKPGMKWNSAFGPSGKNAVVVPSDGKLPRITLDGGLVLTLLSPTPGKLAMLKPTWEKEVRKAGLDPNVKRPEESEEGFDLLAAAHAPNVDTLAGEAFSEDSAEANGSSIAVLAEFEGRRMLLTGDAHPSVLTASLKRLGTSKLTVDVFKLPHHGSKANVSRPLLEALECKKYLFSTNGAHFQHPDQQAVARVIKFGGEKSELMFNYKTKFNEAWGAKPLRDKLGYTAVFPQSEKEASVVEFT